MKQLSPQLAFKALVATMSCDNGFNFTYTDEQAATGLVAIEKMMGAGIQFPDDADVFHDINGIYWEIAAGEATEKMEKYKDVPGYIELDDVLNEIFDTP